MDAPISTFFRISPSLLNNMTTPRSQSSSTFSSPSFAEHQTGHKAYRESPASLNSAKQDNPLFEGFPVLLVGDRKQGSSEEPAGTGNEPGQPGDSPKLQQQLHHLLTVLQRALELHNTADGLPDDLAPVLADELEAVARKLKEKEREMPVERQLRAKVQLALTGAEATIRNLRATPSQCSPAGTWGPTWRCNEAAASSPTLALPAGSCSDTGGAQQASTMAPGRVRDSVCKQLLQSPSSSSLSPLSWTGPTTSTCTPLFVVGDERLASPKELPTEQHRGRSYQGLAASGCGHVLKIPTHIPLRMGAEGASSLNFRPPLYNWMKAVLNGSRGQSPQMGAGGESLASAVHSALSNTRTPPLIYGSPLHRRIQRLLAEQRSPSPLHHAAAQTRGLQLCVDGIEDTPNTATHGSYGSPASGQTPASGREVNTDSPATSNRYTETSSSCHTPASARQDEVGALPFRSSVSPFGPTLRERYGRASSAAQETSGVQTTSTAEAASVCKAEIPVAFPSHGGEQAEAAALVAELGLDLQLDPATSGKISNLEVLAHVERWAREQYIAAQRVLQATKGPVVEGNPDCVSPASSGCADVSAQALIDIAIQTEPVATRIGEQVLPCSASTPGMHVGATSSALLMWKLDSKRRASAGSPTLQLPSKGPVAELERAPNEDADVGIGSPLHRDQAVPFMYQDAAATAGASFGDENARDTSGLAAWARDHHVLTEFGTTSVCRGLFRASHSSGSTVDLDAGVYAAKSQRCSDDRQEGCSLGATNGRPNPGPAKEASLGGALSSSLDSPAAPSSSGGSVAHEPRCRSFHPIVGKGLSGMGASASSQPQGSRCGADLALPTRGSSLSFAGPVASPKAASSEELPPEILFTPGISSVGSKVTTGRHFSRVFPAAGGTDRGHAGDQGDATPRVDVRSGSIQRVATGLLAGASSCGPPVGVRIAPSTLRDARCSVGNSSPRDNERSEPAPEVLFTPGNAQPSSKIAGGRGMALPFRLASAVRFDDETEDGDASAQTLSSISSVSIIASEPVIATNGEDRRSMSRGEPTDGPSGNGSKSSFARHLRDFITSLIPCSHGGKAN